MLTEAPADPVRLETINEAGHCPIFWANIGTIILLGRKFKVNIAQDAGRLNRLQLC